MSLRSLIFALTFTLISLFATNSYAVIIEGKFTGTVNWASDCVNLRPDQKGECSLLWNENPQGSVASGSFWYDTDIAPPDTVNIDEFGQYFTYTNEWVNMFIDIGGKHFDISDSPTINDEMWDVEHISIVDRYREPDGLELQSITIADKTSSGISTGNFVTKRLSLNLTTWEKPIVSGTSLIQEYSWQENGDLLQGFAYFDYESFSDGQIKYVNTSIKVTDFSINVRRASVPEPSSLLLFTLIAFGIVSRRLFFRA